jgi:hypothetical protein
MQVTQELNHALRGWRMTFANFLQITTPLYSHTTKIYAGVEHVHADMTWRMLGSVIANSDPSQTEQLLEALRYVLKAVCVHERYGSVLLKHHIDCLVRALHWLYVTIPKVQCEVYLFNPNRT